MDSPFSIATAATRGSSNVVWGGLRLTNPVVNDRGPARRPEAAKPSDDEGTTYTPGRRNEGARDAGREGARPSSKAIATYEAVSQSISYERSDSFALSVRTAQGDTATISIAHAHSESASLAAGRFTSGSTQGQALALNSRSADSLDLQISVGGDLNDAETASINALLQKVQGVADDFFAGNQAQASAAAAGLNLGSDDSNSSLSAFSFELQTQQSLRAVATYQSVATATAPGSGAIDEAVAGPPPGAATAPGPVAQGAAGAEAQAGDRDFLHQLLSMFEDFARSAKEAAGLDQTDGPKPQRASPREPGAEPPAFARPAPFEATA